jgi:hypothetical protein
MATLRIDVQEAGKPSARIDIPLWLARGADILLPDTARKNLSDKVDIDRLLDAAEDPRMRGVLLEIEDHTDGEKVTISIV